MVPKKSQFSPKVPNFAFVELFWGRSQIPNPVLERLVTVTSIAPSFSSDIPWSGNSARKQMPLFPDRPQINRWCRLENHISQHIVTSDPVSRLATAKRVISHAVKRLSNIPFTAIARCSSDERNTEAKIWEILVTWNAVNWNCKLVAQVANWWRTLSPLYKAPNQFWVSDTNISGFVRCWDLQPSPIYSDFLWKIPSYGPLKKTAPSQRGSFSRPTT